jgi:hypothetical protein
MRIIAVLVISAVPLCADTLNVPADHAKIQEAIDAAANGDTVLVAEGTYEENIDFKGKTIAVKSACGPEHTVINGRNPVHPDFGSVVSFSNGESCQSLLEGFTITGGKGTVMNKYPHGGGIFCLGSSPTIRGNVIRYNNPWNGTGSGIYCEAASPVITNNIINRNGDWSWHGGGIACWHDSSPIIINNVIAFNEASLSGGGIDCYLSSPVITNNTIVDNKVTYPFGPGLYIHGTAPVITNNIIWSSTGNYVLFNEGGSGVVIEYCNVKGGYPGTGNFESDPLFVDLYNGDFHLTFNSPCRGSGTNAAPKLPELDFEGDPRIYQGTADIGADEFHNHLYVTGDKTPGGDVMGMFIGLPGSWPVVLLIGTEALPAPRKTPWGDYYLQTLLIVSPLVPITGNGTLPFPVTLSKSIPVPYDIPMQALIGLGSNALSNLCVLEIR